jgi:alkanesulfonate monooxygenase SsuD/methylene tetrahydromethanopterin reductase-like flavin-dependent oxidoreductase (luciferase family)
LGVIFLPQLPPERLRDVAVVADEAGLEELWLWEDCFSESGLVTASAVLAWTSRLRVGIGLLPVPLRNVALTAMEVATLERLFPGRATVGIGHGVQSWMGQVGARVRSPLTLLREYLVALRSLLAGEEVSTQGRYVQLDRVVLDWAPPLPFPVYAGAEGPLSLRLSGEFANGTIITAGNSPEDVRRARELIAEGTSAGAASAVGASAVARLPNHQVVVYLHAATGPNGRERLAAEHERWGEDPAGDLDVCGDAASVAEGIRRWAAAGAGTVVLQPTRDDPDLEAFIRFIAQDVRPLLRSA